MSFLDIMSCGFGAIVLILLISQFQTNDIIVDENQTPSIQKLEEDIVNSLEKKIKLTSLIEDLEKRIKSINSDLIDKKVETKKIIKIASDKIRNNEKLKI